MSTAIHIAIAEPSLIIRSGVIAVLRRLSTLDIRIVEAGDLLRLCETLRQTRPEILIINSSLLPVLPVERIREASAAPRLKCIVLRSALTGDAVTEGCDGEISLMDSAEQIKEKLLSVHTADRTEEDEGSEQLSAREKEIIVGVVRGLTNKQIAEQLYLSPHTVITHRRNIASKLQIHSAAGLTIYAIVNHLVELNDIKQSIHRIDEEE